jgi:hypothetical protein
MKIKVVANELVDSDIEMVSLVRHGANRCAFKLLKTDDTQTLSDKLGDFLHLNSGDPKITAFYIKKAATEAVLPILKTAGFAGETQTFEGVNILKVSDGATKSVFQLTDSVAVGIDQPVKLIADEGIVKAHAVVVGTDGFYPGIGLATTTLDSVVWNLLNSNGDQASPDRLEKTESMLASFRKYVGTLLRVLPKEVLQVEGALRSHEISKEAGTDMQKATKLVEAVSGDLDILKADAAAATTEVAAVVEEPKIEASTDQKVEEVVAKEADKKEETKVEVKEETPVDPILAALAKIEGRFDTLQEPICRKLQSW